ncbi:MAG: anthranilate synthase component I [Bacteroidota bacterium]|nr:anthranilate synthase component I [Bacteroidota bacterium]MDW8137957.1 anthranilate synthase component I [Bacteroidota bacterium]
MVEQGASRYRRLFIRALAADLLSPVSAYLRLRRQGALSFLLESVEGGERLGRYSFIGCEPIGWLRSQRGRVRWTTSEAEEESPDVFRALEALVAAAGLPAQETDGSALPRFSGGAVGYIGYEAVRHIERLPEPKPAPFAIPEACFGLYDTLVAFDHVQRRLLLLTYAQDQLQAQRRLRALEERLRRPAPEEIDKPAPFMLLDRAPTSNQSREAFEAAVRRALAYIEAGDVFQVVLSQRWGIRYTGDPFQVYRALRIINPSPYLFYLDFGDFAVFGSSPEVLVRVEGCRAELLPIAGTRRRGRDPEEDAALERELLGDPKEQAEHVMLVDLGRNDLGRVAEPGSVRVERYGFVERYSHVMHLVSHVTARLRAEVSAVEALRACFPAGTVTGAPKVRAMEIIHELEPESRGPYAGAVGYLDLHGNLDTCIAIRTFIATRDRLFYQAGAGVVADSLPEREYEETLAKARALERALALASANLELSAIEPT